MSQRIGIVGMGLMGQAFMLWRKAPIEERGGDGKRWMVGGKRSKRGTLRAAL